MKTLLCILIAAASLRAAGDYSNRRAPGFSLADSHFQQHDTQDYRGKILLIDVMATTCPTCGRLADVLVALTEKYGDKIAILSLLTNPDTYRTGDLFAAQHHIAWPLLYDSGQVLASYLKATPATPTIHFPHLFLIDQTGWIGNDFDGTEDQALTFASLSAQIDKLLLPAPAPRR